MSSHIQPSNPKIKSIHCRYKSSEYLSSNGYSLDATEQSYLLKYFPKYYNELHIDNIENRTITKIKRVKTINHFYGAVRFHYHPQSRIRSDNIWLVLLQNKRKCLKTLPIIKSLSRKSPWMKIKHFPNISCLGLSNILPRIIKKQNVYQEFFDITDSDCFEIQRRDLQYLEKTTTLKRIDILITEDYEELTSDQMELLNKLLASKDLLSHLDVLSLEFDWISENKLLSFLKNKTLCKYITHFHYRREVEISTYKALVDFLKDASNLRFISVAFEPSPDESQASTNKMEEDSQRKEDCKKLLRIVGKLLKLKALEIDRISDFPLFLEYFSPSKSLEHLKLGFNSLSSMDRIEKSELVNSEKLGFENLVLIWSFCPNLSSLDLDCRAWEQVSLMAGFFNAFTMQKILLLLTRFTYNWYIYDVFLDSIPDPSRLKEISTYKLKELILDVDIQSWEPMKQLSYLKNLSHLEIRGNVPKDVDIKELIGIMKQSKINNPNETPFLKLKTIVFDSDEDLILFLKKLRKTDFSGVKVDLALDIPEEYEEKIEEKEVLKKRWGSKTWYASIKDVSLLIWFRNPDSNCAWLDEARRFQNLEIYTSGCGGGEAETYYNGECIRNFRRPSKNI